MDRMPGEGPQPTAEEYRTRIAPQIHNAATDSSRSHSASPAHPPRPKTLDEALAVRQQAADEAATRDAAFRRARRDAALSFWKLIEDFLGRNPPRRHALTGVEGQMKRSILGGTRNVTTRAALGSAWFVHADPRGSDDSGRPTVHEATFVLQSGRLVTGEVQMLFDERYPTRPPGSTDITISGLFVAGAGTTSLRFIERGDVPDRPVSNDFVSQYYPFDQIFYKQDKAAEILASYL